MFPFHAIGSSQAAVMCLPNCTRVIKRVTTSQALNGLSGIGKSEIALEYAYRYGLEYQALCWVKADTYQDLVSDFASIARELDLPEKNDPDQNHIVDAVKFWLQGNQNFLLILDNVRHEDLEWMCNLCPRGSGSHVLLTTRTQIIGKPASSIGIEKMDSKEGILLILRRAGKLAPDSSISQATQADRVDAKAIVTVMDGLPLALEQAAAYIEQSRCSLSNYLRLYRKHHKELFPSGSVDHESVTTTWSLSFKEVEQHMPAAADLLRFCAFLDPDAIPVEQIIAEGAHELGPVLQSVAADPIELNKAIEELRKFSLVRYSTTLKTQILTIHRLVQDAIKDGMDQTTRHLWEERTVRALNQAFPKVEFQEWYRCQQCLPHVLACLPFIKRENITCIEVTQLLNKAGSYLRDRAQYAQAMELIEQALKSRKNMLTLEEADEATSLHNMALLYFKQGRYADSEPYYQNALTIRKKALGMRHPIQPPA